MLATSSPQQVPRIKRYHPVDLVVASGTAGVPGSPFDAEFAATFTGPAGQALTVPGFYDGDRGYIVRFCPTLKGPWHYETRSSVLALDGVAGSLQCIPNDNPDLHGQLLVDAAHPHHFIFEDGTRRFLMGYEVNWLMMIDQRPSDLTRIDAFLDSITRAGFNMLTVNVYAHSCLRWLTADQESDDRYIKAVLAPWVGGNDSPDYGRFDLGFFRHFDRVMLDLLRRGVLAHVMIHVYNKQVNWPELGSSDDDRYWRYVIARYQAFCNIIWDTSKESYYQPPEYIWYRLGTIRHLDGYRRLITVHDANTLHTPGNEWRERWHDPRKELSDDLADFKSDQVHQDWYADAARNYGARQRPYVNIEYGYEEGVEDLPTYSVKQDWREVLRRTWLVTMGGGYPNYYYSNTAWNLFVPTPEPPGYAAHRLFVSFWEGTRYWTLGPDNRPLGESPLEGIYYRAHPGREYVVFDETGKGFHLTIEGAAGELRADWFNPLTGQRIQARNCSDGTHQLTPPWGSGNWAVLHLRDHHGG